MSNEDKDFRRLRDICYSKWFGFPYPFGGHRKLFDVLIAAVREEEREKVIEECAKIAESPGCMTSGKSPLDDWCKACSRAIRALKETP